MNLDSVRELGCVAGGDLVEAIAFALSLLRLDLEGAGHARQVSLDALVLRLAQHQTLFFGTRVRFR